MTTMFTEKTPRKLILLAEKDYADMDYNHAEPRTQFPPNLQHEAKTYDFTFFEGYWKRSFRLTTTSDGRYVESWNEDSVRCWNMNTPYIFDMDSEEGVEDFEGVVDKLCHAFDYRNQRKDSRDICVEVREGDSLTYDEVK